MIGLLKTDGLTRLGAQAVVLSKKLDLIRWWELEENVWKDFYSISVSGSEGTKVSSREVKVDGKEGIRRNLITHVFYPSSTSLSSNIRS